MTRTRPFARLVALAAALALTGAVDAARAQTASPQLLSMSCAGCHGPGGRSTGAIPAINGRTAQSIAQALRQFRADQKPLTTVMNRIAKGYSDAEIDALPREISTRWK